MAEEQHGQWGVDFLHAVEVARSLEGINLKDAKVGDFVFWRTMNSHYRFQVERALDPESHCRGIISGGIFGDGANVFNVQIVGATFGSPSIVVNQIKKGMGVELRVFNSEPDKLGRHFQVVITSAVQDLKLIKADALDK